ncbi:MAG TPA: NADH-ubiquinone oxidoreductase-F iron-sulfur binding region domain-containing protein [Solirubrobacteraceae bacterium]|jgi:NADH:ubiquinone oxidoreductase subunit F (NADH-binding)|nr:NADH-ubiquinone oxidoreductase-F iron-sulfur binding region domain-containing protein [Solirubrobacteraceae bacterium]
MSVSAPPTGLPRLLAGVSGTGALSLARHLEIHGPLPAVERRRAHSALALVNELERSGLRGRGGAAFPAATKVSAVAAARGRAIVVANGCEGEPMSLKDRLLLERVPHLVLDGALVAAHAVEATDVLIAVDESATRAVDAIERAVRERPELGRGGSRVQLATVPSGYVTGQESAVLSFLGGGPAKPMAMSAPIYRCGLKGRPTLVSNVETLAHMALIGRHGGNWFRTLGAHGAPGSTLVTVGGAVAHPGVFEIETGTEVASLVQAAGGATGELQAFLLGGYAGTWVPADVGWQLALSPEGLHEAGAALGAGVVFALPSSACAVSEIAFVARWLSGQSAGQCGPCVYGLDAVATGLDQVRAGAAGEGALGRITRWASLAGGRGACAHPDGAASFIISATHVFAAELADHARRGPCARCAQRHVLPTPAAPARRAA